MLPEESSNTSPPQRTNRRSKPQLSCHLCRRRKLRCNRQKPCSSCTARGLALSCKYPSQNGRSSPEGIQIHHTEAPRTRASIRDRVVQLEEMVVSLIQNPSHEGSRPISVIRTGDTEGENPEEATHTTPLSDVENSPSRGSMIFGSSGPHYVSGTHWAAILDSITDLKEHLEQQEGEHVTAPPYMPHVLLLYGCESISKEDILQALPPKVNVDRFVSQYFNRLDLAPLCLHSGQFQREYEKFWNAPSEAPIMWLALLFSMICLSVLASNVISSSPYVETNGSLVNMYREKIVQCLTLGEYTKPGRYTLEALYNYMVIEYSIKNDANKDICVLIGILINLAIQMGYHRDPSHFPEISPFTGEMRRRIWATLLQGDILITSQAGMPRIIKEGQWDTIEPRNLHDFDFNESTLELPPSRPETEVTDSSLVIARQRILTALGNIADLTTTVQPYSYAEVMEMDRFLYSAESRLPSPFRMNSIGSAVTDSPQIILNRLFIRLMFHKGQIMLHRKYLHVRCRSSLDEENNYAYSRKSCLEAALKALEIQRVFFEETGPNGYLHELCWKFSSFVNHEFLTATMVLCFFARHGLEESSTSLLISQEKILDVLDNAHEIWVKLSESSKEAQRASDALGVLLAKLKGNHPAIDNNLDLTLRKNQLEPLNLTNRSLDSPMTSLDFAHFEHTLQLDEPFIGISPDCYHTAINNFPSLW
ncbi:hypothetical protein BGW36DRAFT_376178 [Talaromyces proteolyticus]|uniref:Zn(2)-C6 fungal-type domain-containing protein n=1 Tax=Talaromyces proteolyticus TaxID=1131652 RepID=A0AAD4KSP1_9EURO|nr:uncharacterized protein BGW36DRAFT_376178 [Talaromyces proteolyticus]KAH8698477.1 hypothetical protein BGW36DRAFT_376178 [Talaromyces proteolyticus]